MSFQSNQGVSFLAFRNKLSKAHHICRSVVARQVCHCCSPTNCYFLKEEKKKKPGLVAPSDQWESPFTVKPDLCTRVEGEGYVCVHLWKTPTILVKLCFFFFFFPYGLPGKPSGFANAYLSLFLMFRFNIGRVYLCGSFSAKKRKMVFEENDFPS